MKMNILKRACPVCDSFEGKKVFKRDFSGMSSIVPFLKYEIVQCEKCGMMYADNLIESMPLAEYYNVLSKYDTMTILYLRISRICMHILLSLLVLV